MVETSDVGSLPFAGDPQRFLEGALHYRRVVNDSAVFFERKTVDSFIDKVHSGINVPNYPQYRDMNHMFLDLMEGISKVNGGYIETGALTVKDGQGIIHEVLAIKNRSQEISEKLGKSFKLRVSVTGPYTLSTLFAYKDKGTFIRLGDVLSKIVDSNIFDNKHGSVSLVTLDEPVFGFIDDPLLDKGSETRENLLKAWELIMQKIVSKGAQSCLHLHSARDELFWEIKHLNAIEMPVNDSFYQANRTKERLESTDKFLNASISVTDFDQLIRANILATAKQKLSESSVNEKIADVWKNLRSERIAPSIFLEDVELMRKRLVKTIEQFGANRVLYAVPECGLRSFPTYESALECLRRVSLAAIGVKK
jgi:5-methyltetrahydropteroyltriglutamate--homocysteine methyltransferase